MPLVLPPITLDTSQADAQLDALRARAAAPLAGASPSGGASSAAGAVGSIRAATTATLEQSAATTALLAKLQNARGLLGDFGDLYGLVAQDALGLSDAQAELGDSILATSEKTIGLGLEFGSAGAAVGLLGAGVALYADHQRRAKEASDALRDATAALTEAQSDYSREVTISGERSLEAIQGLIDLTRERAQAERAAQEASEGFFESLAQDASAALVAADDLAGGYNLFSTEITRAAAETERLADSTRDAAIEARALAQIQEQFKEAARAAGDLQEEIAGVFVEIEDIGRTKGLSELQADADTARGGLIEIQEEIERVQALLASPPPSAGFFALLQDQAAKARALYLDLPRLIEAADDASADALATESALESKRKEASEAARERAKAARAEANEIARVAASIDGVFASLIGALREDAKDAQEAATAALGASVNDFFALADKAAEVQASDPWRFLRDLEGGDTAISEAAKGVDALSRSFGRLSKSAQSDLADLTARLAGMRDELTGIAQDALGAGFADAFSTIAEGGELTAAALAASFLRAASQSLIASGAELIGEGLVSLARAARLTIQSAGLDPRGPLLAAAGAKAIATGAALGGAGIVAGLGANALTPDTAAAGASGGGSAGTAGVSRASAPDPIAERTTVQFFAGGGPGSTTFVTGDGARATARAARELGTIQRAPRSAPGVVRR